MKKILNIENLSELSKETVSPAISIYLPLNVSGKSRTENKIRLNNLLKEAEKKLADAGTEKSYSRKMLAPAYKMNEDAFFWKKTKASGLAIFLTPPRIFRYFELPDPVEESLRVGSGFRLDPLREILGKNRDFYLLTASKNSLALYIGSGGKLSKLSVKGMPKSIKDMLPDNKLEKNLETHGAAPRGKMRIMHGQGGKKDIQKTLMERYFQETDNALKRALSNKNEPMVFAGDDNLYAAFRSANTYQNIFPKRLPGNLEKTPLPNLFKKASDLLKSAG